MIKLFIHINDETTSFTIIAKKGREILGSVEGNYQFDLADKLIKGIGSMTEEANKTVYARGHLSGRPNKGLDKNLTRVNIKKQAILPAKRDKIRVFYDSSSKSFVSNLIVNSVAGVSNWLQEKK